MIFRRIEYNDIKDIQQLIDESFGKNYLTFDDLLRFTNDENYLGYCLLDETNFVGFISLQLLTFDTLQSYFLAEKEPLLNYFKLQSSIAAIEQVVISPLYRSKGYSNLLLSHAFSEIESRCNSFICVCWVKEEPNFMRKLLLRNNFSLIQPINHYWKTDSLQKRYDCTICGAPPCLCNAEIYELKKP